MGRRSLLVFSMLLFSLSLFGQTDYKNINCDKILSGTDKLIYVQPPEGKYWIIVQGGIQIEHTAEAMIAVYTETAPYSPYRDPITGALVGCTRCVRIVHADATRRTWFPIVGGYSDESGSPLYGQLAPITVTWPNRLMLSVSVHGALATPIATFTRFTVIERDIPHQ